ncbi:GNAT family N-acetyltransferase [Allosalinactinospora lopnorensis]|uniref:GNAT family N-acetyltransferase n=1 Tax=Allosalinactinospora lopnorensis TaxID=1352348 RepID=UPI000623EFE8|nr:GNAT family N-acetyltransferase [Allosalinactinospora lopnorensis]
MAADADQIDVRNVRSSDVAAIVELVIKDERAGSADPSPADTHTRDQQRTRVQGMVGDPAAVSLVATRGDQVVGYLFSAVAPAPPEPVAPSAPAGPVGYVTDFAVLTRGEWWEVGTALLARARDRLRELGAERVLVTLDAPDPVKRAFLWRSGLTLGAERYETPLV